MKKDRKRRKEAVKRLEKLEDMNRAGEEVNSLDLIGALYPKFVFATWREKRDKETCAELLEEVKSLVDIKDYITCPRSKEGRAIHIGDRVYKVDGDGDPLIVEEIIIRHGGTLVQCSYANNTENIRENHIRRRLTRLSFFSRELTFGSTSLYERLNEMAQKLDTAYKELREQIKKEDFSLDEFLFQF
jgi:hypothetical protein